MSEKQTYTVPAGQELRVEVAMDSKTTLTLESGEAEVFGAELAPARTYNLTGLHKIAVFSFRGATVSLTPEPAVVYVAEETTGMTYLNLHVALEQQRAKAATIPSLTGPRILVAGGGDAGKTTLCRTLLNYAVRAGKVPLYVDLDPAEGSVTVPGTLTATAIPEIIGPEEGFAALTAGSDAPTRPIVYHYGTSQIHDNADLYAMILEKLAKVVNARVSQDPQVKEAGIVVDTAGAGDAKGIDTVAKAVEAFEIETVLVLGNERLYSTLVSRFKSSTKAIHIVKLPKAGGAVDRDEAFRRASQREKIRSYFYGFNTAELAPCHVQINWARAQVYRLSEASIAPDSALPIGGERQVTGPRVVRVESPDILLHTLLAIVPDEGQKDHPKLDDQGKPIVLDEMDAIAALGSPVIGFACVHEVDLKGKWFTALAPMDNIPSVRMVSSVFRWVEE